MIFPIRTSLLGCIAGIVLTGCSTTGPSEAPKADSLAVATKPLQQPTQNYPMSVEEDGPFGPAPELQSKEPDLDAEDFGDDIQDGFCADDIYTRYLTKQYMADHPAPPRSSRKKSRRAPEGDSRSGDATVEALFYAKNRLAGGTVPYFGALPIVANHSVERWVQYFKTSGRREFMKWLVRGESVKRIVQPLLQDHGIPMEFFYLAMVESGFNNGAYSRARATGTWQFMRGTAQLYGLKIDNWVDERRDPIKSSIAAAAYLKDLYNDLGDWHLAMAAYNAGPGKIRKAIRRGGSRDFWALAATPHLAKETKQYVPKVLAAILLASDAKAHGFDCTANPTDGIPDTEVIVKRPVRLEELAASLGISLKTLVQWNPELIRNVTPPASHGYSLRLSSAAANAFPSIEQKLSQINITDVQLHVVRHGDTLSRIARQYKVGVKQILSINPHLNAKTLKIGKEVAVPVPGVVTTVKSPESA